MPTWALHTSLDLDACNVHLTALENAGLLGLVEEDGATTAYFPDRVAGLPIEGRWEPVPDTDWNAAWRASIAPVVVADVAVYPPWLPAPAVAVALEIEPAQAFGTGHHETTAGCLAALQEVALEGCRVLDVGTGTGVLALAALRLGARSAVGIDVDPIAVEAARHNAAANGLPLEVRQGSMEAVADGPFDVVLANVDTDTITAIAGDLAGAIAHDGVLVASGVSLERLPTALDALAGAGIRAATRSGREWAVLIGHHRDTAG